MTPPRFNSLAPHYAWIEALTFGNLLQWCRTTLVSELTDARRVLVIGEGDGRFISEFLKVNPNAAFDIIDASSAMVALAQQRISGVPGAHNVRWYVGDARRFEPPGQPYDLIVTNFFLDCFPLVELEPLIARLVCDLSPGGRWLIGDFSLPQNWVSRLVARVALAGMYACFMLVTRIPASRLVDPQPSLQANGLTLERRVSRLGGFLVSSIWRRPFSKQPRPNK